jgi:uncharacterized protein YbdZ (MbtH family)
MNITNTIQIKDIIEIPIVASVEEVIEVLPVEEVIEVPLVEEATLPPIKATVYWTVLDGTWTYMDTYYYTEAEWNEFNPANLQDRQVAQYVAWREYCQAPVTDISEITSTTIEEII